MPAARRTFALVAAALVLPGPAVAGPARFAVADFEFFDTSGETRDQSAAHAARLAAFTETLRDGLAESGVEIVLLDCQAACTGGDPGSAALSETASRAGARYLLVGQVRKVSTLIGAVMFGVLDLTEDRVACDRSLSYRGDTDEAWARAAAFAVRDVAANCLDPGLDAAGPDG